MFFCLEAESDAFEARIRVEFRLNSMRLEAEYFYSVARDTEGTCKGNGSSEFRLSFG